MYCMNCGAKIPEGAAFCECCGTPVVNPVHQRTKKESGGMILARLLICCVAGFLLTALMQAIPENFIREGAKTNDLVVLLFAGCHAVPVFAIAWKPFGKKLGAGFGGVAAFLVAAVAGLCIMSCVFHMGEDPMLMIPGTLLYGAVLYGIGVRFGKKEK